MRLLNRFLVVALALAAVVPARAGVLLEPKPAPQWSVSEWINGDPGPLVNQRGRVVVIEFFQLWCPGCNEFSLPLMNAWHDRWADRDDILLVSIHTVFEGHDVQTPERLREFVREKNMHYPVGIDKYPTPGAETPVTMDLFQTGGTPHMAIVDKEGDLRFSHFGRFDPYVVEAFVERLAKERGSGVRPGPKATNPGGAQRSNRNRLGKTDRTEAPNAAQAAVASAPGRPGPAGNDGRGKPAQPAGDRDNKLNGSYQLQFQQRSKSCGTRARPENTPVDITFDSGRVVARFKQRFLGLNQIAADYDEATGKFGSQTMRRTDEDGTGITLNIELNGQVDLAADPPTLQFQFQMDKEGDEPGWECKITGNGSATRSKR